MNVRRRIRSVRSGDLERSRPAGQRLPAVAVVLDHAVGVDGQGPPGRSLTSSAPTPHFQAHPQWRCCRGRTARQSALIGESNRAGGSVARLLARHSSTGHTFGRNWPSIISVAQHAHAASAPCGDAFNSASTRSLTWIGSRSPDFIDSAILITTISANKSSRPQSSWSTPHAVKRLPHHLDMFRLQDKI